MTRRRTGERKREDGRRTIHIVSVIEEHRLLFHYCGARDKPAGGLFVKRRTGKIADGETRERERGKGRSTAHTCKRKSGGDREHGHKGTSDRVFTDEITRRGERVGKEQKRGDREREKERDIPRKILCSRWRDCDTSSTADEDLSEYCGVCRWWRTARIFPSPSITTPGDTSRGSVGPRRYDRKIEQNGTPVYPGSVELTFPRDIPRGFYRGPGHGTGIYPSG